MIPVARPWITQVEIARVTESLQRSQVAGGPAVELFERLFAKTHGAEYGVTCNSGTTALQLALRAVGIGPGSLVAIPSLTMVAVANAVLYCGARPVFVDSDQTGNPCPQALERVAPLCGAVVIPHLYGQPAHEAVRAVRRRCPTTWIIQDCAEAHYVDLPLIDHRTLATFSFYGNKIITCGEGGMVLTQLAELAERLAGLRAHAFTPGDHFNHQELAYGYRMTEMAGAVGLAQHSRYLEILARRAELARQYERQLQDVRWLQPFIRTSERVSWWVYPVLVRRDSTSLYSVARARNVLAEHGIETRRFFSPLHGQRHLAQYVTNHELFPVATDLHRRGFYLPLYPEMTPDDVGYIASALRSI